MRARVGDRLRMTGHDQTHRFGVIVEVEHSDGRPPYLVRWLDDGRESLVFPGEDARIEPDGSGRRRAVERPGAAGAEPSSRAGPCGGHRVDERGGATAG